MPRHYTDEKQAQVLIALLKEHRIRKVIASPGTTNMAFVGSIQNDSFFEMYSSVDERSAAYIACGLAAESGEPVVISCTGATASRNYLPGLTEAYYRKLPVLAVTSTQPLARVGHHIAQIIDRSSKPIDTVKLSITLPVVKDAEDLWDCEIKVNQAILELTRDGGGPVHLNLSTSYSRCYDVKTLPEYRVINRITNEGEFPQLPTGRIAVFIGSHGQWNDAETSALERFCEANNAVVICDHTSGYKGKFRLLYALAGGQVMGDNSPFVPELLIHIGEITGDYYGTNISAKQVWRVNQDGEIRDTFKKLRFVFEMSERCFFGHYAEHGNKSNTTEYYDTCNRRLSTLRASIPELPFSNVWLASQLAHRIPSQAVVHFGILNSLRSWNFYELPDSVTSASNVGGFGIDGGLSTLLGSSLAYPDKLYFGVIGDLAFFYDMNSLGNRHIGRNIRILLVNNGKGTEFRQYKHHAEHFKDDADKFIAAAGHFGCQSRTLVKHYAEDLGFEYFSASNKEEFTLMQGRFLNSEPADRPILYEVFTNSTEESQALELMLNIDTDSSLNTQKIMKGMAKRILGEKGTEAAKKWMKP
jgi:2-succinyl-5-enolpyruvyl-6-hydroxy-3-cyclohexene-1-carboxylate synthase